MSNPNYMSVLDAQLKVTGTGRNSNEQLFTPIVNTTAPPPEHITISVPATTFISEVSGGTLYSWMVIIPTGANANKLFLKGITGDTGIAVTGTCILPINAQSQVGLYNSDSSALVVELYFF